MFLIDQQGNSCREREGFSRHGARRAKTEAAAAAAAGEDEEVEV